MTDKDQPTSVNRRGFLGLGSAVAAAAAGLGWTRRAAAHNLPPGQFGAPPYDKAISADGGYRAVFQSANIEAAVKVGNTLDHLLPIQVKNWLNAFQFSYRTRPEDLHVVVATYASANLLTYGDAIWKKYKLGEKYNVVDPSTNAPGVRNLFWSSRFGVGASTDPDQPQSVYQDTGIEALHKRGVMFLT
jgi:hypothetical protein